MSKNKNIFLIGPMGVGKTTIGRVLAKRLGKRFYDSDDEIERKTGAPISLIFDIEGESGFRRRESKVIDELTLKNGVVLATGGGAILSSLNQQMLSQRGIVIFLEASAELLIQRTKYDTKRPLLHTKDRRMKIKSLLQEREQIYSRVADSRINVDNMSIKETIKQITEYIHKK